MPRPEKPIGTGPRPGPPPAGTATATTARASSARISPAAGSTPRRFCVPCVSHGALCRPSSRTSSARRTPPISPPSSARCQSPRRRASGGWKCRQGRRPGRQPSSISVVASATARNSMDPATIWGGQRRFRLLRQPRVQPHHGAGTAPGPARASNGTNIDMGNYSRSRLTVGAVAANLFLGAR